MIDILEIKNTKDLIIEDFIIPKASNVVSVQLGSLEYLPAFGVDMKYFLNSDIVFQNESFKSYVVDRLTQAQINVAEVFEVVENFIDRYTFTVGDTNGNQKGLIK